ncbi:MAG: PAS domain S-box protein [Thermodesulfobacteriota bacterium]
MPAPISESEPHTEDTLIAQPSESFNILYMEDDPGLARLFQKRFQRAGHSVDLAHDGETGLALAGENRYDVLVVDHNMPKKKGLEVIRVLSMRGPLVPTIMVTGAGDEMVAVEAMKLGAADYIVKDAPGRYLDLIPSVIERALANQRLVQEKRLAEEALRASEEKYRLLVNNAPVGIASFDLHGRVREANPKLYEILGPWPVDHDTVLKEAAQIGLDQCGVAERARQCAATSTVCQVEIPYVSSQGKELVLQVKFTPAGGSERDHTGCLAVVEDITERKIAEEHLTWKSAVDSALAELYVPLLALDGSIETIASKILETAQNLTTSRHGYVSEIDPVTKDNICHTFSEMMAQGCSVTEEKRIMRFPCTPTGTYRGLWGLSLSTAKPVVINNTRGHHASTGLPPGHIPIERLMSVPVILGEEAVGQISLANPAHEYTGRDLAAVQSLATYYALAIQRKRAQDAVVQSEERYRTLFERAADPILILDADGDRFGTVVSVNQVAARTFGCDVRELLGKSIAELTAPQDRHRVQDRLLRILAGEWTTEEVRYQRMDGTTFPVESSAGPLEVGNRRFVLSIDRDITERKQVQQALEQAKRDLEKELVVSTHLRSVAEAANRAKSEFLANMSHELRTPLNAIIGFSEILADLTFGPLNEKQIRYVQHVLSSGRHLMGLIDQVLDLAKVESGKMELMPGLVSVRQLLENSLTVIREKARVHGIQLSLSFPPQSDEIIVYADEFKLRQIMYNLLSNAAKFTPDGGRIDVKADRDGNDLVVSVTDTGIGLKPEDLDRIFDPFVQVDASYERRHQGTGLGLVLTKRLVLLHGGRITARSDGEHRGSTLTFAIPICGPGDTRDECSAAKPTSPG